MKQPSPSLIVAILLTGQAVTLSAQTGMRGHTPVQRFFEWTDLSFSPTEFRIRRQAMMAQLQQSGGGVFLAPSSEGVTAGETFRQENDFLYFTGLELPRSLLVLNAEEGLTILFVPRTDARFENPSRPNDYPGRPLADDPELSVRSEIAQIRPIEDLEAYVAGLVADGITLRINFEGGDSADAAEPVESTTASRNLRRHIRRVHPAATVRDAYPQVARLRMVKSDAEVAVMRRNAQITAHAIMTAAGHIGPGVQERGLEAEFEAACKRGGSQRLAFASIIKSGPNSLWPWRILAAHYNRRNRAMYDGELVIFDVGCELDYYAADVGRTFPVSGRFTDEQRDILSMVIAVSDSIIAAVRPGITLADLQAVAERAIPEDQRGYMQTGLFFGHHIGLSVGDPDLPNALLEPGMVFTVEPWYYDHEREVAVFIEDDVLVTAAGAEVLTSALPRRPDDLERLVGISRE